MTLKWLGPGYFGSKVAPGDDMPDIDKRRLEKFIKAGKVGTIAEKIDLEKIESERVNSLEKENADLKKKAEAFEKISADLKSKIESYEKEISDLVKVSKKKDK